MKRLFITLSIILLFVTNSLTAQSGDISVIRVEFFSPVEGLDYWVRIKEDGLSNIELSGPNKTKAWMLNSDGSILKKPVAYVSGSTPRISACFKIAGSNGNCRNANGQAVPVKYFAKADILDEFGTPLGMELPSKQLVKSGSNTVFEYLTEAITSIFEKNKTRYFDQFKISWKWSRSIDGPWEDAGTTDNRLYVTHAKPIYPGSLASPIFHTCLYLGCVAANNQTQDQNVFDEINQEFATKCIKRVDDPEGNCLNYYGDPILTRQNRGLEYLLENASGSAYEDGRCNEWVDFLTETINAQGLDGQQIKVLPYNPAGSVGVFSNTLEDTYLIEVEQFFGNSLFPTPNDPDNPTNVLLDDADPVLNLPGSGARLILHGIKAINQGTGLEELVIISRFFVKKWDFSNGENQFYYDQNENENVDIVNPDGSLVQSLFGADQIGLGAQGLLDNPYSIFDDHVLFKYNGQYYDPSYGKGPFADKYSWVNELLDGYGTFLTYINPQGLIYYLIWLHQLPSSSNYTTIKFIGE